MAVNIYYGTCVTEAGTAEKVVRIKDSEITTDNFDFGVGDLLVVYFSNMNSAAAPSLVVTNGDTEEEVSTSNDTGKFIKINSIEEIKDPEGIWDNGETVVFAYTKNINNNDNVYYWELIDAARASEAISGVTKLYGNTETNISKWLNDELEDSDFDKALTPGILKKFFKLLMGQEEPEPEPEPTPTPIIKLNWTPAITDKELIPLGQLSLTTKEDSGITIDFPLDSYIRERIGENIKKTSDIANDGPDPNNPDNVTTDGHFYITNVLPSDKSLYYTDSPNPYKFLVPNDMENNNNLVVNSKGQIQLNGTTGTDIAHSLKVNGNIAANSINCGPINSGAINAGSSLIQTSGSIKAGQAIQEYNTNLNQRYSGFIQIVRTTQSLTVDKKSSSGHRYITNLALSGFTLWGIVGFNINYNSKNTGDATWCHLWECAKYDNSSIQYAVRNHADRKVSITIVVDLLYIKNT